MPQVANTQLQPGCSQTRHSFCCSLTRSRNDSRTVLSPSRGYGKLCGGPSSSSSSVVSNKGAFSLRPCANFTVRRGAFLGPLISVCQSQLFTMPAKANLTGCTCHMGRLHTLLSQPPIGDSYAQSCRWVITAGYPLAGAPGNNSLALGPGHLLQKLFAFSQIHVFEIGMYDGSTGDEACRGGMQACRRHAA